jgi:hypothetical protein
MKRKFDLINQLSKTDRPRLYDLHKATGIPESTIKRQLAAIRADFDMTILFVRDPGDGERGNTGYYMLTDWGILNRSAFIKRFSASQPI